MCGIAGILRTHPPGPQVPPREESIREEWLDILDESIRYRGPDGVGRFRDRVVRPDGTTVDVALIHRRMAIIDIAGGHQPMLLKPDEPNAPDQVAVVFNGCIYNHRELRKQLEAEQARFRTDHSDTEVLLWGWRKWGRGLFERTEGMCAAAVWDPTHHYGELTLVRDEYGEKPLWRVDVGENTHGAPRFTAFCSSAAGLLRLTHDPSNALDLKVARVSSACRWLGKGYADHLGWITQNAPDVRVRRSQASRPVDGANWARTLELTPEVVEKALAASVEARLESDRAIGCFLSGGVDSSLIAHFARKSLPSLRTFCLSMPDSRYDESTHAAAVAKHLGTQHTTLQVSPRVAEDTIDLIESLGLPFADSSLLPTYWLCQAAREHVVVALAGDGGDELFAGYERHRVAGMLANFGPLIKHLPVDWIPASDGKSVLDRARRFVEAARYGGLGTLFGGLSSRDIGLPQDEVPEAISGESTRAIEAALQSDLFDYLPNDILLKTDTASMRVALEVRAPFLDSRLAALARSATIDSLMPGGQRKGLLRALARKHLPASIVDRPKMGFAVPIADWFRSDFGSLRTLLGDLVINAQDPFPADILGCELNRSFIRELFDQHMSGKRDHAQRLYALLVMAIWCRWYRRISRTTDGLPR